MFLPTGRERKVNTLSCSHLAVALLELKVTF